MCSRLIGSLGHVLGHSFPHFILQVGQLLPVWLQLQPLVIWHLKEDKKDGFENISLKRANEQVPSHYQWVLKSNCKTHFIVIYLQTKGHNAVFSEDIVTQLKHPAALQTWETSDATIGYGDWPRWGRAAAGALFIPQTAAGPTWLSALPKY